MKKKVYIVTGAFVALMLVSIAAWACNSKSDSEKANSGQVLSSTETEIEVDGETLSGVEAGTQVVTSGLGSPAEIEKDKAAARWADSVMKTLSLRQRIAQLFVPRLDISNNQAGYKQITQMCGTEKMGGFLLGKGSIESYADLINKGQSMASVPLMITLDGEWGLSMRISGTPRFPYNIALGAADNPELCEAYGREMARECRLMGIQVNFAPVLDVNSNPDNPVIGYRSFGEDPQLVGSLGAAYCRGMSDGGVLSVGKHFPGHGDTSTDSHKTLPTVDHSEKVMTDVDMAPFVMAIKDGMPAVMVGHLKVPSLDASGTPSSLSKKITTDLLQNRLGFKGLIFTDALAMKGASRVNENNCVSAFLAGADILLGSSAPVSDLNAVEAAVKSGKIKKEDVDARCRKVLMYKYVLGLTKKPVVNAKGLAVRLNSPHVDSLIMAMSREAITVLKNEKNILPIGKQKVAIVNIGAPADNKFVQQCKKYGDVISVSITDEKISQSVRDAISSADAVVYAVYKDAAWSKKALSSLSSSAPGVGVFFLNPFKVAKFSGLNSLSSIVLCYDDIAQLRVAAAEALYGKIKVKGKLPVNLAGLGKVGNGLQF